MALLPHSLFAVETIKLYSSVLSVIRFSLCMYFLFPYNHAFIIHYVMGLYIDISIQI